MTGGLHTHHAEIEWREIPGFPEYEVSDEGGIRRRIQGGSPIAHAGRVLKLNRWAKYLRVCLHAGGGNRKWLSVHRIVAMTFHGAPPTPQHQAAHNDGNRTNNRASNIRWATPKENHSDQRKHGTLRDGEKHPNARLADLQIAAIREAASYGVPQSVLASIVSTTQSHISRIIRGESRGGKP